MKKIQCFIASAFGRADVDSVYDNCILPTLRKLSINPSRVDRVEHNDDIDDKIMKLLNDADLVIADLTYARPSVYFEAGFAFGLGKPVVYISRSDHFRARDNDPEGLLKVHFDLQMKNIIPWSKPNETFSKRLEKRLKYVLRPLINQRSVDENLKYERDTFRHQSESSKLKILHSKAHNLLKSRSFSFPEPNQQLSSSSNTFPRSFVLEGIRKYKRKNQKILLVVLPTALKGIFESTHFLRYSANIDKVQKQPVQFHYFIVSLRSVPRNRITQNLSYFRMLEDGTMHYQYKESGHIKSNDMFVHVISGVSSTIEFTDDFRSILARYDLENL